MGNRDEERLSSDEGMKLQRSLTGGPPGVTVELV